MIRLIKHSRVILSLLICCISFQVFAQPQAYSLKGVVLDENTNPVANVSVSIEGVLTEPVITKENGEFEINVADGNIWLLITPVGDFKSKRIYLNYRNSLTVNLISNERNSLDDEISTLNGIHPSRDVISSYRDIALNTSFEQSNIVINEFLAGRVSGLIVQNHSGMPGDGTYSYMRGIRSLHTNNQPLVIVDGIPMEKQGIFRSIISGHNYDPATSIDPQDITSITVLKDGAGTANFGLKSSNGVILIETLKPTETTTSIDFSLRSGYSLSAKQMPVLDNVQYRTLAHEVLQTSDIQEEEYDILYPGLFTESSSTDYYRYIHNTNWQDEVFRNSSLYDVGLSIKGGDAISKYGLSVGYQNYEGIIKNTDYNRINLRFVGSFNVFKWMELYVSTSLSNNSASLKEQGISTTTSPIYSSLFKTPVMAPYQFDEAGQELTFLDDVDAFGVSNPTTVITKSEALNKSFKFLGTFSLIGHLTENLMWNSLLGLNFGNMRESLFLPNEGMEPYFDQEAYNEVHQQSAYIKAMFLDNYIRYTEKFNKDHHFSSRIGIRTNTNHSELDNAIGRNTPSDEYTSLRFTQTILSEIGGDIGNWNWMSLYSNIDYKYKDKYILGVVASADGSSRTGEDAETALTLFNTPFGLFYSVNAAWRLSSESFLRDISFIDELKIRVSYGLRGNDDIGNYNSRRYYSQVKYRESTGLILGTKPNTRLKFESNQGFNLGLDYSMLGEKVNLRFDYFNEVTKDMLIFERQEDFIGYSYTPTNGGEVKNTGFEAAVYGRIISSGAFKLDAAFNISHYTNEVISIKGGSLITKIEGAEILSSTGHALNSFYGYISEGVFTTQDEASQAALVNDIGLPYMAGDIKFSDLSGPDGSPDGVINEFDKTIIGSANPDLFGGLTLMATYKRWSLSTVFQFMAGNEVFNYLRYQTEKMTDLHNQSTSVLNRWQYEDQQTNIPRATWNDPMSNSAFSTRWIEDGSYLRLKNISLAYTLPEKVLVFKNAKFFVTAMNLLTFTKYLGYDPEFSYSSNQLHLGVDYGLVPQSTTFLMGVKFGL